MRKNCKKQIKENSEQKRQLKEKVLNYLNNGKDMLIYNNRS